MASSATLEGYKRACACMLVYGAGQCSRACQALFSSNSIGRCMQIICLKGTPQQAGVLKFISVWKGSNTQHGPFNRAQDLYFEINSSRFLYGEAINALIVFLLIIGMGHDLRTTCVCTCVDACVTAACLEALVQCTGCFVNACMHACMRACLRWSHQAVGYNMQHTSTCLSMHCDLGCYSP